MELYDVVRGRDYATRDGEKKTQWDRVGMMMIDGDRISIKLETVPVAAWDGWLKAFPRDGTRRENRRWQTGTNEPADSGLEDDVPF